MVDVDVRFNVGEDQPVNADFEVQPDVTFIADLSVETAIKNHDELNHRDYPDQHPIESISGLSNSLEQLSNDIVAENERAIASEENLQNQIDDITASAVTDIIGGSNIDVERYEGSVTINTSTFVFEQGIASDTWIINHNLNKRPSIQLVDSSGRGFEADREYTNNNQVIIHLQSATTGFAYLN